MQDTVIELIDLKKSYGRIEAVRGLNLAVPRSAIFGFLGRNGAGKTTTIKMLLGMTRPSGGSGKVLGRGIDDLHESLEIRKRTGFVSEDTALYDYMSIEQMIKFTRSFYPAWRLDLEGKFLKMFELPLTRKIKTLSKGMRSKLALLLAFSRGAELLVLDEPTNGLDPAVTEDVLRAMVSMTASDGITIFFSSHQISEVEQIADHICIIDSGKSVLEGEFDELKENFKRINILFEKDAPLAAFKSDAVVRMESDGRWVTLIVRRNPEEFAGLAQSLNALSVDVVPVTLREMFLESVKDHSESGNGFSRM